MGMGLKLPSRRPFAAFVDSQSEKANSAPKAYQKVNAAGAGRVHLYATPRV